MVIYNQGPVAKAEMLIRKSVELVFEAFINPEVTTKFWFTKSSGRLEVGKSVRWDWEMYGVWDEILVKQLDKHKRIIVESSDGTTIDWVFTSRADHETFVTIENYGFTGSDDEIIRQCMDSVGGFTMVLCGLKALLEHNVELNLISDKAPDARI
ncbi:hypothetical protein E6C60_2185 [Paenibacillus algicola]|uniref:Activator of Hsp90 ATPase homologue 1/2-like C-terminal domain-containing protein n=1 Tax=Paenibacillus algicola TaxID=2565926 RepID=A0A4P8XKF8_9BACL|nr:SRPBCC family protein [Paenibacillus algicola]QCT02898.1 hypothetical protein E6C60_2185 [Paenibacillus algicola]